MFICYSGINHLWHKNFCLSFRLFFTRPTPRKKNPLYWSSIRFCMLQRNIFSASDPSLLLGCIKVVWGMDRVPQLGIDRAISASQPSATDLPGRLTNLPVITKAHLFLVHYNNGEAHLLGPWTHHGSDRFPTGLFQTVPQVLCGSERGVREIQINLITVRKTFPACSHLSMHFYAGTSKDRRSFLSWSPTKNRFRR